MRAILFLFLATGLGGCGPTLFVEFSHGYDPATTRTHALPAIALAPGETRRAMAPALSPQLFPVRRLSLASESPLVAEIWRPYDPAEAFRIRARSPGSAIIHKGYFPFSGWDPQAGPMRRAAWREEMRRALRPRPDIATFRSTGDEVLWREVLRSRSTGALRVVVEEDRLDFQMR